MASEEAAPVYIPPQLHTDQQAARRLAREIAGALNETNVSGVLRVVLYCGEAQARAWLAEVQRIEQEGGILTTDGARRRTPGGVYFKLVKDHLFGSNYNLLRFIFRPSATQQASKPTGKPARPAIPWGQRGKLIAQATTGNRGRIFTVKVTLIGKLGKTIEKPQYTLAMMSGAPRMGAMPKGLPVPDRVPVTQYIIYIGSKQWRKVREAVKNPEDTVIIEGTQFWDNDYESIAVFATNITTKLLQQAQREALASEDDSA